MNQMDKELASTSLGSSFVKKETNSKNKPKVCNQYYYFYAFFLILIFLFVENCSNKFKCPV
jgi:hypothetical protein